MPIRWIPMQPSAAVIRSHANPISSRPSASARHRSTNPYPRRLPPLPNRKTLSMRNSLLLSAIAFAFLACAPVQAAPVDDAAKYVETLGNQAVATISNKTLSKEQKQVKIESIFREN